MPLSPVLRATATYPFVRLNNAVAERRARGLEVIDLGMGDPREPTDSAILDALRNGVRERMGYPAAVGLPELRDAVAAWVGRRFGVALDPGSQIIPTLGSKEAIFSFAQVVLDAPAGRDTVVVSEPGYPVPGRGAAFAGARVVELPLLERHGFIPALDHVHDEVWDRAALVWLNSPNNPTGAIASLDYYARLAALARERGFVLAADEAYSELWFEAQPESVLQLPDLTNVVAFNTLSKRSSMTGFRSGFVAGDPALIGALRQFRPNIGTAPQEFVQRASVVAWGDEAHVARARDAYRRKRDLLLGVLRRKGLRDAGGPATMYLWIAVPEGETSESHAARLLERGVLVTPGVYLGSLGRGVRTVCARPHRGRVRAGGGDPRGGAVSGLRETIDGLWERGELDPGPIEEAVALLDSGALRVAEPGPDGWRVNEWAKKAILLYFRLRKVEPMESGGIEYLDKIPVKRVDPSLGVRVVPPGVARYGSFLSEGVVLMPGYVNIGAWIGPRTMVDTWATVGSCAQIGADVHLAGGVGIGGVLEPPQATPVIVEDGAFLGSRCIVTEGVRVGAGAVLSANVSLTASVPVIDVTGAEPVEYRGEVPPRAVVVPGTRPKEFPAGTYQLSCALIVGWRGESHDLRLSLNDVLREFELAV